MSDSSEENACPNCEAANPDGKAFCSSCGTKLAEQDSNQTKTQSMEDQFSKSSALVWLKQRPKVLVAGAVALVVILIAALFVGLGASGQSSSDPAVISKYDTTCGSGSSGPSSITLSGASQSAECANGDGAGGLSSLFVVGSSGIQSAIKTLSDSTNGFSCFVVGIDWVAVPSANTGLVSLAQDAQFLQQTLGGSFSGACGISKPASTPTTSQSSSSPSASQVAKYCGTPSGNSSPWSAPPPSFSSALNSQLESEGTNWEPGSSLWISQDRNNSSWYQFCVITPEELNPTPSVGGCGICGNGITELGSTWSPINGPSEQVCTPMPGVPNSVLSDFGGQWSSYSSCSASSSSSNASAQAQATTTTISDSNGCGGSTCLGNNGGLLDSVVGGFAGQVEQEIGAWGGDLSYTATDISPPPGWCESQGRHGPLVYAQNPPGGTVYHGPLVVALQIVTCP